jgi:CRISPR-associated endonuclease/helicase Cas3
LPAQVTAIQAAVGEPVEIIHGPQDLEKQPRYCFHELDEPNWARVQQELAEGGKVLWVCNQVNTAIAIYEHAKCLGLNALLYHSRFRYGDRVKHHRAVVDGFKPDAPPVLAVATQVAEMSLDLSATLLVTQIADPAGLIQRLGRLNRRYCGYALDAVFYPEDPKMVGFPYSENELATGLALVRAFSDQVNQAQLANWLEQLNVPSKPKDHFVLLDGKWRTYPAPLREAGYTVTALLEQDERTIETLKSSELPRYTVPLRSKNAKCWPRHKKGYLIAPADQWGYSSELGAFELKRRGAV